jgi:hypothetical protein
MQKTASLLKTARSIGVCVTFAAFGEPAKNSMRHASRHASTLT